MKKSPQTRAIFQALFVTFLWSTSWVLIKISLNDIPPLIFAGLRYSLAALLLLPAMLKQRGAFASLTRKDWRNLVLLGIVFYALTQGGQFVTMKYLDTITFSLLLNFSTVVVALLGIVGLRESPSLLQWGGIALFIGGVLLYFLPQGSLAGSTLGFLLAGMSIVSNAVGSLMGRSVNREKRIPPMIVTGVSMGIGAVLMLGVGVAVEPWPKLSLANILVILWLGAVNTAFAFYLWNISLQHLTAMESSIINNTMMIQIAVLSWIFLHERLNWMEIVALLIAAVGIFLANIRRQKTIKVPES
ncbi:DMT family transporter [Chloroflexota bacterium]|nr:DMT family transporter [Chloroflexota bacterium]